MQRQIQLQQTPRDRVALVQEENLVVAVVRECTLVRELYTRHHLRDELLRVGLFF